MSANNTDNKSKSGINLQRAPKKYSGEQDKTRPPAQTVEWVRERFGLMGQDVLRQTMRIDTGRLDIPVYISLCGDQASMLTGNKKQMGKGASPDQAEASALMELAERFSFFYFMQNSDFPWGIASEVGTDRMDFAQAAKAVYHSADDLERAGQVYEILPQQWAWARNLSTGAEERIPLSWFFEINEYNGPAAGNCQEEAVLQSLCEVVERHVCAVVTLEKRKTPAIDPASLKDPVSLELLEKFEKAGIKVYLKDFTCDMGIPTVAALCYDPITFPESSEIVYAAGTSPDPEKALIRALTEVAQLAGDFQNSTSYKVSALPKFSKLEQADYVMAADEAVPVDYLPNLSADDFRDEVINCVGALSERGFSVYTMDVTHPVLQVPAVYTIVPGAHFAERTTGTDVIFHAAKLAAQIPSPVIAIDILDQMTDIAGTSYATHFFRAVVQIALEEPENALLELQTALNLNPPAKDEASIHTQIGAGLKDLGQYEDALLALGKAASFAEVHHEVFNLSGFCLFMLKRHEESIEAFSKAVEIEPGAAINYANIGSNLRELGRLEEACEMYENALEMDPGLDFARDNLQKLRAKLAG